MLCLPRRSSSWPTWPWWLCCATAAAAAGPCASTSGAAGRCGSSPRLFAASRWSGPLAMAWPWWTQAGLGCAEQSNRPPNPLLPTHAAAAGGQPLQAAAHPRAPGALPLLLCVRHHRVRGLAVWRLLLPPDQQLQHQAGRRHVEHVVSTCRTQVAVPSATAHGAVRGATAGPAPHPLRAKERALPLQAGRVVVWPAGCRHHGAVVHQPYADPRPVALSHTLRGAFFRERPPPGLHINCCIHMMRLFLAGVPAVLQPCSEAS